MSNNAVSQPTPVSSKKLIRNAASEEKDKKQETKKKIIKGEGQETKNQE
jgi:hypothetical protein